VTNAEAETFSEPVRVTLVRTVSLALAVGVAAAAITRRPGAIPIATLAALWFTLGGHYTELLFRNTLLPRLSERTTLRVARVAYWFAAGSLLYGAARLSLTTLGRSGALSFPWWIAGVGFIGAELLVHARLRARRQPSFYDGRG